MTPPAGLRHAHIPRPAGGTRSTRTGRTARAPVPGRLRCAGGATARVRPRALGCRARAELEIWRSKIEK